MFNTAYSLKQLLFQTLYKSDAQTLHKSDAVCVLFTALYLEAVVV